MRCQHCGANLNSNDELQEHQITSCPAILSDDDSMLVDNDEGREENVQVIYKWLEDRSIPEQVDIIHLIIENLDVNIPLNKCNGSFRSDWTEINVGTYCGQLVIDGEIFPIAEFNVEPQTEAIFVMIDREDDTYLDSSTMNTTDLQQTIDDPSMQQLQLTGGAPSVMGEPLSEEHFADSYRQEAYVEKVDDNLVSPDVPTLQNVDNITSDKSPQRYQPSPTEHQQPFENDLRDDGDENTNHAFAQMSGNSTPRSSNDDITPRDSRQSPNVNQILYELSLTSPEAEQKSPTAKSEDAHSLPSPGVRRQRSYDSSFQGDEILSLPADPVSPRIGDHASSSKHKRRSSDGNINIRSSRLSPMKIEPLPSQQKSYTEEENKNLRKELKRLEDLTQNYKEVKAELEVKCQSYDEEVERLKVKNQELQQQLQMKNEEINEMKTEVQVKCQSLEDETKRIQSQYENALHEMKQKEVEIIDLPKPKEIEDEKEEAIRKLQIQLESSQNEIERLKCQCKEMEDVPKQMNLMYQGEGRVANLKKIEELEKRCEAYGRENERLQRQCKQLEDIGRQNAAQATSIESEHESDTTRLQSQCRSYEEDLTKKEIKLQQLRDLLVRSSENEESWSEEKLAMQARVKACNEELEKLSERCREYEAQDGNEMVNRENADLLEELTAKCQNYETHIEELQEINNKFKDKYSKLKETAKQIHNQWKIFEMENTRLKEENQSLETVLKLKEKDFEIEKMALESLMKKIREENTTLKLKLRQSNDNEAREKDENKKLRKLLEAYKQIEDDQVSEDEERVLFHHQPKIKSPQSQNLSKYVTGTKMTLPDRPIDTGASRYDYKDVNGSTSYDRQLYMGKRTKSAELFTRDSAEGRNSRYSNQMNGHHAYTSSTSPSYIDDVMKRYRTPDTSIEDSYTVNTQKKTHRRSNSSKFGGDPEIKVQRHPKAKSYDYGINYLGKNNISSTDNSPTTSPRQMNHFRQPFCPTFIRDIQTGMKVSVTRANGRLSRGTIRWVGYLPKQNGEYVGVELESESGKHDGTYDGVRYFRCKEDRGVFVKFSKIVMAWK